MLRGTSSGKPMRVRAHGQTVASRLSVPALRGHLVSTDRGRFLMLLASSAHLVVGCQLAVWQAGEVACANPIRRRSSFSSLGAKAA